MRIDIDGFAERSTGIARIHLGRCGAHVSGRSAAQSPVGLALRAHADRTDDDPLRMVAHGMMLARVRDQFDLVRGEHVAAALSLLQTVETLRYGEAPRNGEAARERDLDANASPPSVARLIAADLCSATAESLLQREASELFRLWADLKLQMCQVRTHALDGTDTDGPSARGGAAQSGAGCWIVHPLLMGVGIVNPILATSDVRPAVEQYADLRGRPADPVSDSRFRDETRDRAIGLETLFDTTDLDTDVWRSLVRTADRTATKADRHADTQGAPRCMTM